MKKYIFLILIILWMGLIFFLSNRDSVESESNSNVVIDFIIDCSSKITGRDFNELEIQNFYDFLEFPVRKCAHFTLYLILSIFVFLFINEFKYSVNDKMIIALLICLIYAFSDEIHQLFVSGRSGEFRDVVIDFLGSILGYFIVNRCLLIIKNRQVNNGIIKD